MLAACDVYRPAAIDQLGVLGEQEAEVYMEVESKKPVGLLKRCKRTKTTNHNVVIVDTAGHLAIDEQMMNEIAAVKSAINLMRYYLLWTR